MVVLYPYRLTYNHLDPIRQDSINQIGFVSEKYLRYLPREIPHFPSHGSDHSINIIEIIDSFIDNWDAKLTDDEIYLLYLSAWTHDIGCLKNRKDHQQHSVAILNNISLINELLGDELYTCLKTIVKYHSSKEHIEEVPKEWGRVKLQKICAIFRILDACDITEKKCPKGVYDIIMKGEYPLDKEANNFWQAHMNIQSLQFERPKIKIFLQNLEICELVVNRLIREIETVKTVLTTNNVTCPNVEIITLPSPDFI